MPRKRPDLGRRSQLNATLRANRTDDQSETRKKVVLLSTFLYDLAIDYYANISVAIGENGTIFIYFKASKYTG